MGIARVDKEQKPIRVEEITYADYLIDDSEEDTEESVVVEPQTVPPEQSRRRRQRVNRGEKKLQFVFGSEFGGLEIKNTKRMGSRKLRRLENARLLSALIDPNDICDDFSDMVPETVSAFAQLFIDQSNMKAWNEFIEKGENEQRLFLEKSMSDQNNPFDKNGYCFDESQNTSVKEPSKRTFDRDLRKHHPAYSASACFSRLDTHFKKLFSQRKLPWAFMEDAEKDLCSFFNADTTLKAEWNSSPMRSAWHRLILHGISQYLFLRSKSIPDGIGEKRVQVFNKRPYFIPPHESLVVFLSRKHGYKIIKDLYSTSFQN